jgi:hypothetical protein
MRTHIINIIMASGYTPHNNETLQDSSEVELIQPSHRKQQSNLKGKAAGRREPDRITWKPKHQPEKQKSEVISHSNNNNTHANKGDKTKDLANHIKPATAIKPEKKSSWKNRTRPNHAGTQTPA